MTTLLNVLNRAYLESLFTGMLPGGYTIICGFRGDPNTHDRTQSAKNWCGRPWMPGDDVPGWFAQANSYFTVASFEPDENGDCRRRKSQFVQMHAVMVDDVGTKVPHERLRLQPTTLIETSPQNFQACYFLTDEPAARERQVCERLVDRMIAAGLAVDSRDPGMAGVTRYARLPAGVNAKRKYIEKLGHPFRTRCTLFEPERRYGIAEIAAAYGLDMTPEPARPAPVTPLSPAIVKQALTRFDATIEVFKLLGKYRGKRGAWHDVECPWVDQHTDRADTGTALAEPSQDNGWVGGFVCHHHCRKVRHLRDVRAWMRELIAVASRKDVAL